MAVFHPALNILYFTYFLILSLLYEIVAGLPLLALWVARGAPLDAATRRHNELYGRWIVRGSWPWLRFELRGGENIPRGRPCVIVANHRSFADIFICAMIPVPNFVVMVRSWPFRLWIMGWFMRLAGYVDIERTPLEEVIKKMGPGGSMQGGSFLFFPEGHRSRDGRLQRFRSGAFRMAAAQGLIVVPVCIQGTEALTRQGKPWLHTARVSMEILKPIDPAIFPEENRVMKLKKAVENLYRERLGEKMRNAECGMRNE